VIGLLLCAVTLAAAPEPLTVSHRKVLASDGVALALYRYAPAAEVGSDRPPVLLIADFGMGRGAFDFQGAGLARWLARHGRVAYVAELRGQGSASAVSWSPAEIVDRDLPAIAAVIGEPFDLVAHGWAGTLALAASARELKGRVLRVASLATPAEFAVPSRLAESLLLAGGKLGSLSLDPEGAKVFELLFAMGARIQPDQLSALRATAFHNLGARGSAALLQWMRSGDLQLATGESLKARLLQYDRPTIQFAGLANGWANPELCGVLREVTAAKVHLRVFSRFDYIAEDYSHLSLLQGEGAPKEVFGPVLKFFNQDLP
jgi:hypothetical protein